jgi:hypothetical protein
MKLLFNEIAWAKNGMDCRNVLKQIPSMRLHRKTVSCDTHRNFRRPGIAF